MAMERGGRATLLGTEYGVQGAVHEALFLLAGRSTSLLFEPVGEDEPGVDLWVTAEDGTRTACRMKRENGSKTTWSATDLREEDVLRHAKAQLDRDARHRSKLVSTEALRRAGYRSESVHFRQSVANALQDRTHFERVGRGRFTRRDSEGACEGASAADSKRLWASAERPVCASKSSRHQ